MQLELYGKIEDQFPKALKTDFDILKYRYNLSKRKEQAEAFFAVMEPLQNLNFHDEQYSIIVPMNQQELIEDSMVLGHSVDYHLSQVINKQCIFVFLRHNNAPVTPLLTVEVYHTIIRKAKGRGFRDANPDELAFIRQWAKEKKLTVAL